MGTHSSSHTALANLLDVLGPGPWSVADIVAAGWTRGRLDAALRRGDLRRVRRGMYDVATAREQVPPLPLVLDAHAARVRALLRGLDHRAVVSHESAAHLHGMWVPGRPSPLVHVTIPGQTNRVDSGLSVHGATLSEEFVVQRDGLRLTSLARTAVDLARAADLPGALVVADSAVRLLLGSRVPDAEHSLRARTLPPREIEACRAVLREAAEPLRGWPGWRTVLAAVREADPRSESPFESASRGWILAVGLPRPELNLLVRGASGRTYVGDFVWPDRGVVGEADGLGKYGDSADAMRRALRAEKVRQADLESAGWRVVRWVSGEPGAQVVARLGRALYLEPARPRASLERGA